MVVVRVDWCHFVQGGFGSTGRSVEWTLFSRGRYILSKVNCHWIRKFPNTPFTSIIYAQHLPLAIDPNKQKIDILKHHVNNWLRHGRRQRAKSIWQVIQGFCKTSGIGQLVRMVTYFRDATLLKECLWCNKWCSFSKYIGIKREVEMRWDLNIIFRWEF